MKEIHLICNAHIDPIWQWDWQEGVSAVLSTFQSAVNLSSEFDYIFCHNEVTVYKYVEEYAPDLFESIKALVKSGKWHIMGGWYLQPDCNMPSGESFTRQILEGKRYFKEKFGKEPTTAINFDPFGHSVGLVQIIKKCGQDSYIFMRPYKSEMSLPKEQFIWHGLDGSEIKAVRAASYATQLGEAARIVKERADAQDEDVVCVLWGVGNHGGGPSRKDLSDIDCLKENSINNYIHSTPEAFFARINPDKKVDTSLRISMPGCYTSMNKVKKKHAMLEHEIYMTEKMLTAALSLGLLSSYPEEKMHEIVEDLLNAEFHDVLPGTSVQCGEENGLKLLDHGLLEVERLKTKAYFALASTEEPAREGEYPIIVFNPNPYELVENVEVEFMNAAQNWDKTVESTFTLVDSDGNPVRFQRIKEESNLNLDWRKRIVFEARLKPLSLTRYSLFVKYEKAKNTARREELIFDNGHKYVEIDSKTGLLKRYAIDGIDYVTDGFLPVMLDDNADPWAMATHQLHRVGTGERPFLLSNKPSGVFAGLKGLSVIENGEIYLGIEALFECENTRARVNYKIYKNNDYVDVDVTVFLGDVDRFVKLKLPIAVKGELVGQTAFGTERLFTDARENVAHRFIAMEHGDKALVLMNDSVYGSHFEGGALYMSLVRGVSYCAHPIEDRPLIPTDRFVKKVDQGESSFSFRLGLVDRRSLERETQQFVERPYALNIFPTPNKNRKTGEFSLSLEDEVISLVTVKKADGRDALVIRLLNNTDTAVDTAIKLNGARLALKFGKFEVKTVVYEDSHLEESKALII